MAHIPAVPQAWASAPPDYRELVALYGRQFHAAIAARLYVPCVWPHRSLGMYLVIAYLLLPPTPSRLVYHARYPVFLFAAYWSFLTVQETRSWGFGAGYGIGLIGAWSVLWASTLLIFDDARSWRRIRRRPRRRLDGTASRETVRLPARGDAPEGHELRPRRVDGIVPSPDPGAAPIVDYEYYWETLPPTLLPRLSFVLDAVSSLRGMGWGHSISTLPPPPAHVLSTLSPPPAISRHPTAHPPPPRTAQALRRRTLTTLVLGYLALDMLKFVLMSDPYFLGHTTAPPPARLPAIVTASPVLTKAYRLLLSLVSVYATLTTIFALEGLVPCLLPTSPLSTHAEPWTHPPVFGSYGRVLTSGLAGWWSGWWHALFRLAFAAPAACATRTLGWGPRSPKAKALGLAVGFACSAYLHAVASFTTWPATRPGDAALFFALQPVGIAVQTGWLGLLERLGFRRRMPGWMGGLANVVAVHVWFYHTAGLFTDDLARGGIWLFEPVPISLWRGLGLGLEGEGWWCWAAMPVGWWSGERWWRSGVAL